MRKRGLGGCRVEPRHERRAHSLSCVMARYEDVVNVAV